MEWYRVIKTIKGGRYIYEQRTWREGKKVRTQSRYIGPAGDDTASGADDAPQPKIQIPANQPATKASLDELAEETLSELLDEKSAEQAGKWQLPFIKNSKRKKSLVEPKLEIIEFVSELRTEFYEDNGRAYFNPAKDFIGLPPHRAYKHVKGTTATEGYYNCLFHELVHWTGREGRLNRFSASGSDLFNRRDYSREELVAEIGAVMLMKHFGVKHHNFGQSAKYFQGWLNQLGKSYNEFTDQKKADDLQYAMEEAKRAVKWLIENG